MKIVITGSGGLLGHHLHVYLRAQTRYRDGIVALDRKRFGNEALREEALADADAVIHCAGINRGTDAELETGNAELAATLVASLKRSQRAPHVVYTNTTHRESDSPYGRGKRSVHEQLSDWAQSSGAKYSELVLPHVFGEGGRPNYNSAIHTFCHQLATDEPLAINGTGTLELVHAQEVAAHIADTIERGHSGERRVRGAPMSVASAAGLLVDLHRSYVAGVIPDLRDRLTLRLFNTLRSFMYPAFYPRELKLHTDDRGALFEAVKNDNGGQAFLSTTRPGITRGDHYHFAKVERFVVVSGRAVIRIRRLLDSHVETFEVDGKSPVFVDMPTMHTHNITNIGTDELLTMFWSNEIFDPAAPDTYYEPVAVHED